MGRPPVPLPAPLTLLLQVQFEWGPAKEEANRRKHGLRFDDAKGPFTSGSEYLELFDDERSDDEERFIVIGPIESGIVVVVCTERSADTIRIISARFATRSEIERFRQYVEKSDE
jgi:uncharacterized DUF497 family protein